jgi:hypothetical protein
MPAVPRQPAAGMPQTLPPLFSRPFIDRVAGAVDAGRLSLRRAANLLGLTVGELAELCAAHGCPLSYVLPS